MLFGEVQLTELCKPCTDTFRKLFTSSNKNAMKEIQISPGKQSVEQMSKGGPRHFLYEVNLLSVTVSTVSYSRIVFCLFFAFETGLLTSSKGQITIIFSPNRPRIVHYRARRCETEVTAKEETELVQENAFLCE